MKSLVTVERDDGVETFKFDESVALDVSDEGRIATVINAYAQVLVILNVASTKSIRVETMAD